MTKEKQILTIIENIRQQLDTVKVEDVATELSCTRQNIYWHLAQGTRANLQHLTLISAAITKVQQADALKEQEQLQLLTQKITTDAK